MDDLPAFPDEIMAVARARGAPVVDWILAERKRAVRATRFMHDYCIRLREIGLPVDRATFHIRQIHPQFLGMTILWDSLSGGAQELGREYDALTSDFFINSPVRVIYDGEPPVHRSLAVADDELEFPIYRDLKQQGYTAYTIRPLPMTNGNPAAHSLATKDPAGFDDLDLATMDTILPALSAVVELTETRRTAQLLIETYVGRHTGARVLKGRIRRGDGELIKAVIWLCDLKGFTALTESLPLPEVIQHLNTYFDTIGGPIHDNGGEILKFIGDAILAIFPQEPGEPDMVDACTRAAKAAREAVKAKVDLNSRRNIVGCPPFDCGIALHVGEVMYGNIGAANRLDFTVIGPAVNLAARLEALTRDTGRQVLASRAFAEIAGMMCHSLGLHQLKGIAAPQEVFALDSYE